MFITVYLAFNYNIMLIVFVVRVMMVLRFLCYKKGWQGMFMKPENMNWYH